MNCEHLGHELERVRDLCVWWGWMPAAVVVTLGGDLGGEVPNSDEPARVVGGDEHTWFKRLIQPDLGSSATLKWTANWQGDSR